MKTANNFTSEGEPVVYKHKVAFSHWGIPGKKLLLTPRGIIIEGLPSIPYAAVQTCDIQSKLSVPYVKMEFVDNTGLTKRIDLFHATKVSGEATWPEVESLKDKIVYTARRYGHRISVPESSKGLLENQRRYVLEGLKEIQVETSLDDESPNQINMRGQEIDGIALIRMEQAFALLYFVTRPGQEGLAVGELMRSFGFAVRVGKKKSRPVFGKVVAVKFSALHHRFDPLCSKLEGDSELNHLLLDNASKWGSINIVCLGGADEESILALGILTLGVPREWSRELFDCYNRVGRHMREVL